MVKRYAPPGWHFFDSRDDGGYVTWSDYDALHRECETLRKDAERWRHVRNLAWGVPTQIPHVYDLTFPTWRNRWADKSDFSEVDRIIDEDIAATAHALATLPPVAVLDRPKPSES